jgi:hypothetical protein
MACDDFGKSRGIAAQRWFDLADERNRWGRDVFDDLVA